MECLALEGLHPVDLGEARGRQDAIGQNDEAGAHGIAPVGLDDPAPGGVVPHRFLDRGVEQAAVVEAEPLSHELAVFEDLEARGELHRRDVAHLLEERQVAVALDVTGDAGIAVPVPGSADIAALLAEADVGEAGVHQPVPEEERAEACPDHQNLAFVVEGVARHRRIGIDILQIPGEFTFHADVVGGAGAGLLELPVFACSSASKTAPGAGGGGLEGLVLDDRVTLSRDLVRRLGGARGEQLAAGFRVDADGLAHARSPIDDWSTNGRGSEPKFIAVLRPCLASL